MCASESAREIKQLPLKLPKEPKTTHNTHARATERNGEKDQQTEGKGKSLQLSLCAFFQYFSAFVQRLLYEQLVIFTNHKMKLHKMCNLTFSQELLLLLLENQ